MKKQFDPYSEWLQIPPGSRPPSQSELLGVSEDESDPERIDEAAAVQMEKVRARALGQQSELATRLLNEISQAINRFSEQQPKRPRRKPPELPTLAETLDPLDTAEAKPLRSSCFRHPKQTLATTVGLCAVLLGLAALLVFSGSAAKPQIKPFSSTQTNARSSNARSSESLDARSSNTRSSNALSSESSNTRSSKKLPTNPIASQDKRPAAIDAMVGLPSFDRWRELYRLVVFEKEIHLVIKAVNGRRLIETFTKAIDFAEQICDDRETAPELIAVAPTEVVLNADNWNPPRNIEGNPAVVTDPWISGAVDQWSKRFTLSAAACEATSVDFSADGKWLVTAGNQIVCVWNAADGSRAHTITEHHAEVTAAAFEPNPSDAKHLRLATSSRDEYLGVFSLLAPKRITQKGFQCGGPVQCMAWHPDGDRVGAGLDSGHFILLNPMLRRCRIKQHWAFAGSIVSVAWTPFTVGPKKTHLLTTADEDGLIWLWDPNKPRIPRYGCVDWNTPLAQTFKRSPSLLARSIDQGTLPVVSRPEGRCRQIAWSPSPKHVLAVALDGLELWDFSEERGFSLAERQLPSMPFRAKLHYQVNTLAFHPHGNLLAMGTKNHEVLIFDMTRFSIIHRLNLSDEATSLAWSPTEKCLAAGDRSGKVTLWDMP